MHVLSASLQPTIKPFATEDINPVFLVIVIPALIHCSDNHLFIECPIVHHLSFITFLSSSNW